MHLTALTLTEWDSQSKEEGWAGFLTVDWDGKLQRMVQCCPAVQVLNLGGRGVGWLQHELLLPLAALTSLSIDGFDQDQTTQLLQLSRLQSLSLRDAWYASCKDLDKLAELMQLTQLHVQSKAFRRWMPGDVGITHDKRVSVMADGYKSYPQ